MPARRWRHRATVSAASLCLCIAGYAGCNSARAAPPELLVMIQGADLPAIRQSLKRHGARITHELPIIDAVGARMTPVQLDQLRTELQGAKRIIDDLAWEAEPETEAPEDCTLAAGIQLSWSGSAATWTLYNKGDKPLAVARITGEWPEALGPPVSVLAGEVTLQMGSPADSSPGTTLSAASEILLSPNSALPVVLTFAQAPANSAALQSELTLEAIVDDGCKTSLARSYAAPDKDSYFASLSGAATLHSNGVTGAGITVAVLDSGLWEHPELALNTQGDYRILARYDAIAGAEVEEAFDESGHGTHMTSVLARSGQVMREGAASPSYKGIAPDVDLVAVKAFAENGEGGFLDIVRGVQWVVDNRERLGIRVLNLSFAARPRWPYWEDPVNQALMQAWKAGLFIVAAAGNEGPEPMSVGSPGNLPYLLTVGAITDSWTPSDRNDDYIPDFSSRGPTPMGHIKPDLVALGGHIAGITRPGSTLAKTFPEYWLNHGDFVMTGSSQATALVSGLAALMLQMEPGLGNDELKCMLRSSAEPAIDADGKLSYSPFAQGDGLVSVQRAITIGDRQCEQNALDVNADIYGVDHFRGPAVFTLDQAPSLPGEADLVSKKANEEEGPSDQRRWGVGSHLSRLSAEPSNTPIDWVAIFAKEERRMRAVASKGPNTN